MVEKPQPQTMAEFYSGRADAHRELAEGTGNEFDRHLHLKVERYFRGISDIRTIPTES